MLNRHSRDLTKKWHLYQNGEEDEGHDGLPDFDLVRRDPLEDDEEPDVGEHREEGGHHEHDDLKHVSVGLSWTADLKFLLFKAAAVAEWSKKEN